MTGSGPVRDELLARLAHELASFRTPWEDAARRETLIEGALPRIAATLDLLPPATPASRLLELGSAPFLGSQCLDLVWPGQVTHANYFGTAARRETKTLVEVGGSRTKTYEYDLFNIETDEFPYPDETFDVIIFSELIEHLAINPVWALAEMHRVLKPGGHLIVTTPNALSLERVGNVLRGTRPSVDQYNPVFGYGARHNREYSAYELQLLLEGTGFDVETITARDLQRVAPAQRLVRMALRALLRPLANTSRKAHLFVRARRRPVFRWQFPDALFTEAAHYRVVRHPWVEMGVNDTIQCEGAWEPAEQLPGGGWVRRVRGADADMGGASAVLRGVAGRSRVIVQLRGEAGAGNGAIHGRIAVARRDAPELAIGLAYLKAPRDEWLEVEISLSRPAAADEPLLVNVALVPGHLVAVRRIALA